MSPSARRREQAAPDSPPADEAGVAGLRVSLDVSAVPTAATGAGRYVIELARALAARPDVALSVMARAQDPARWGQIGVTTIATAPSARLARILWEQTGLAETLRWAGTDLHHGPHYTMPLASPLPVVVTIHDLSLITHPQWHQPTKVAYFGRAIRLAAGRANALVAVSQATADRLVDRLGPRAPVHVIAHGVDHQRFRPGPVVGDAAVLAGLGVGFPYVLFLGTIEPRKDVVSLVEAFGRLTSPSGGRSAHPDLRLVLAGSPGWGTEPVSAAIAASPAASRIVRLGRVDDGHVPALLRGAAAVAYPSLEEGFGLPALEALACGAALVTTTGSAMEEVAGPAGLLVGAGDVNALAEALEASLAGGSHVDDRRRLGIEVAAGYTWAASAAAHVGVYRSVR
ncbi:MAG: glycosyltransferase family 4 protein [Acidimicrobiales bacterium]